MKVTQRTLVGLGIIAAISVLIWISAANDEGIACDDDHSASGYCAQVELP